MVSIKGELAACNWQVFGFSNCFSQFGAISGACTFQSICQDQACIIALHCEDIRIFLVFLFEFLDEVLNGFVFVFSIEGTYIVAALQSIFTGDFSKFRAFPAIGAQHRAGNADFASLFDNLGNFFIVTGNVNCFRIGCFEFSQSGFEVNVFSQESFLSNNFTALAFQGFLEYLC